MIDLFLRLVAPLLATAGFVASGSAIGRRLAVWISPVEDAAWRALAAPILGIAVVGIWSMAVLAVGGLPPVVHFMPTLVGFGLMAVDRRGLIEDIRAVVSDVDGAGTFLVISLLIFGIVVIPFALGPVVDWDSLAFHARVPGQLVAAGRLFLPPDNLHIAQLGIAQVASIPFILIGLPAGPALLAASAGALVLVAATLMAVRVAGEIAGRIAAAAMLGTPLLALVAMTPRADAPLAAVLLVAMVGLVTDIRDSTGSRIPLVLTLLGVAAGTKYHGLAFAGLLLPWLLWSTRSSRGAGVWRGWVLGAIFGAPWFIANAVHFHAPFYPFFATAQVEPWLAHILGQATLPTSFDTTFQATLTSARQSFNLVDFLFHPAAISIEVEGAWYRPSLLLLALPIAMIIRPRRIAALLVLPALGYAGIVLLAASSTNVRYLLPALGPLLVAVSCGTTMLLARLRTPARRVWQAVLIVIGFAWAVPFALTWRDPAAIGFMTGRQSEASFRQGHPDPTVRLFAGLPSAVDSLVPPGGRVLFLFEARGGAFHREVLADTRSANWPLLAQTSSPRHCLAGTGITNVLLNLGAVDYYLRRGASASALHMPAFSDFARTCLVVLYEADGFVLFRIDPAGAAAAALPTPDSGA